MPLARRARGRTTRAGFSQGGALALFTGLQMAEPLAGILCMSSYLPRAETLEATAASARVPVMFLHGDADPVIPIAWARLSHDRVKALGAKDVSFKSYRGMPHSASDAELHDAAAFLERALPHSPAAAPSVAAVRAMSSVELKRLVLAAGGDPSSALEKSELLAMALRASGHADEAGKL